MMVIKYTALAASALGLVHNLTSRWATIVNDLSRILQCFRFTLEPQGKQTHTIIHRHIHLTNEPNKTNIRNTIGELDSHCDVCPRFYVLRLRLIYRTALYRAG